MNKRDEYAIKLRDPRWQKKRLRILERDGWACRNCHSATKELQVHHKRYDASTDPWSVDDRMLQTLCADCHARVTGMHRALTDHLRELDVDQLLFVGDMLNAIGRGRMKPVEILLEHCAAERARCLEGAFTSEASARLEAIDDLTDRLWAFVASGVERTYA